MNQMMKFSGITAMLALALAGCQKDAIKNLTPSESRIYITNHDSSVSFSAFSTFSIADSAGIIEDNRGAGKELTGYDAAVIAAVTKSMQDRGFRLVDRSQNPDIGINVSRIYNNYTGVVSYPSYWDSYGGYYDPYYWGYGGIGYYDPTYYGAGYYDVYQVTQGALSIDILNLKDARQNNTIKPLWSALARGEGVFTASNVTNEVNAFFDQSPYLQSAR
jgi:Domain of unknown function (DUF4136)